MTEIDSHSQILNEPNHVFWARVNKHLELTGKINSEDADQIFPRSEVDIETLERQIYVASKIRLKKADRQYFESQTAEKDLIKKWDEL